MLELWFTVVAHVLTALSVFLLWFGPIFLMIALVVKRTEAFSVTEIEETKNYVRDFWLTMAAWVFLTIPVGFIIGELMWA